MSGLKTQVQLVDFQQVQQQLQGLENKLQRGAVRAGLVSVAKPITKNAKELVAQRTGALSRALTHRNVRKRDRARLGVAEGEVALLVSAAKKVNGRSQLAKQRWLELGTRRMGAKPFLAPALQSNSGQVESRFYSGMADYLERRT